MLWVWQLRGQKLMLKDCFLKLYFFRYYKPIRVSLWYFCFQNLNFCDCCHVEINSQYCCVEVLLLLFKSESCWPVTQDVFRASFFYNIAFQEFYCKYVMFLFFWSISANYSVFPKAYIFFSMMKDQSILLDEVA